MYIYTYISWNILTAFEDILIFSERIYKSQSCRDTGENVSNVRLVVSKVSKVGIRNSNPYTTRTNKH